MASNFFDGDSIMKLHRICASAALFSTIWLAPAWGVSKDMVQLQTQVEQLQQQMRSTGNPNTGN